MQSCISSFKNYFANEATDKMDRFLSSLFASDLCLIYELSLSARVCISDKDRLLMF
jgi:hypothetical protein